MNKLEELIRLSEIASEKILKLVEENGKLKEENIKLLKIIANLVEKKD